MKNEQLLDHANAERILEEGWALFQQKGYRGVSVDEICARCALSKPTLYYYFSDKEDLFVQVLRHKLQGFRAAAEQPGSLAERFEAVAVLILTSFQNDYSILLRDREHLKKPENLQKIRDAFHSELFGPLNQLMQEGIETGELKGKNPEILTLIFLGMINNLIGKAPEMNESPSSMAHLLTLYFLDGARQ